MRELSAAIMLFTADTKVLSTVIYDLNEGGDLGQIAVLGITMLVITFAGRRPGPTACRRFGPGPRLMPALPKPTVAETLAARDRARQPGRRGRPPCGATAENIVLDIIGLCLAARRTDYIQAGARRARRRRRLHDHRPRAPPPTTAGGGADQRHRGAWRGFR